MGCTLDNHNNNVEESGGEMHDMRDYIDVSNQENVAPVYFQSLSID